MSDIKVTKDPTMDVAAVFAQVKQPVTNTETVTPVQKTPLQQMKENQTSGMAIVNNNDDGPKRGGPMTDERYANANNYLSEMDELIAKTRAVSIIEKPKSDLEMAELVDSLDNLDLNELERQRQLREAAEQGRDMNVVKDDELVGAEINTGTSIASADGIGDGMFVARGSVQSPSNQNIVTKPDESVDTENKPVQVVIDKSNVKPGDIVKVDFTDEERTKLQESTSIELINVRKINVDVSRISKPVDTFMNDFKTNVYNAIGGSVPMTFAGSRFRGTFRGLTFGEYLDLALSSEIGNVEKLNKRLSIIFNAMVNSSIGVFASYDDFLKNFAFVDIPLAIYALYISTNPETLGIDLRCGGEDCGESFNVSFSPRSLLRTEFLSDYYSELMEKTAKVDGADAMKWHEESSLMTRTILELPTSEIALEMGLRSCYENIHYILPFATDLEEKFAEKYPDDINKTKQVMAYVSKFVSAIYFKDKEGEYTARLDNMEDMIEVLWNIPMTDYAILDAMINQTEEDYGLTFGITDVSCPKCGRKTAFVSIDLDGEVFQRVQEQGNITVNRETLPRL